MSETDQDSAGDLADIAAAGNTVENVGGAQQDPFENTDYSKLKFNGVQQDLLETALKRGDEVTALVRGRITGVHDDTMADGHVRHTLVVKVESVKIQEGDE